MALIRAHSAVRRAGKRIIACLLEADRQSDACRLRGDPATLDGIGPEELGLDKLEKLLAAGEIKEVILATNSTVEGEATAHFISEMVKQRKLRASRIAHGIPMGGELEYVGSNTILRAFAGRQDL